MPRYFIFLFSIRIFTHFLLGILIKDNFKWLQSKIIHVSHGKILHLIFKLIFIRHFVGDYSCPTVEYIMRIQAAPLLLGVSFSWVSLIMTHNLRLKTLRAVGLMYRLWGLVLRYKDKWYRVFTVPLPDLHLVMVMQFRRLRYDYVPVYYIPVVMRIWM